MLRKHEPKVPRLGGSSFSCLPPGYSFPQPCFRTSWRPAGQAGAPLHSWHVRPSLVIPALLWWMREARLWGEPAGPAWSHTSTCSWAPGTVPLEGNAEAGLPLNTSPPPTSPRHARETAPAPASPGTVRSNQQHTAFFWVPALPALGVCGPELFTRLLWSSSPSSYGLNPLWPGGPTA